MFVCMYKVSLSKMMLIKCIFRSRNFYSYKQVFSEGRFVALNQKKWFLKIFANTSNKFHLKTCLYSVDLTANLTKNLNILLCYILQIINRYENTTAQTQFNYFCFLEIIYLIQIKRKEKRSLNVWQRHLRLFIKYLSVQILSQTNTCLLNIFIP